jgi:hypothetical protein
MPTSDEIFKTGVQYLHNHDYHSALHCFQQILVDEPDHYGAELNAGVALNNLGLFTEALPFFLSSAKKDDSVLINGNLGICLYRINRFVEAAYYFNKVLAVEPDNALMQYNLAYTLLSRSNYRQGWPLFAWRKKAALWCNREPYPDRPYWKGESLDDDQKLVIFHEQGSGDTLMLVRYLPQVIERAKNILLICPVELCSLLEHTFHVPTVTNDLRPADADYQCSMFDLPEIFGMTVANVPKQPYLFAPPGMVAQWQQKIMALPLRPNVGLVWAGSPRRNTTHVLTDSRRSLAFDQLAPFFDVSHVNFISLQKGESIWQARCSDLPMHDWTDQLVSFADTAGLIANLDLVITVDTSVVHLAAGMGKPVWLLNRFDSCWRWQPEGYGAWYDTVRDFRQSSWNNWDSVIQRVCAELHILGSYI